MTDIDWKQVMISIFVGASVAFCTTVLQGLLDVLHGAYPQGAGGIAASAWYAVKKALWVHSNFS